MELAFRTLATNGIRRFALPTRPTMPQLERRSRADWLSERAANRSLAHWSIRSARSTTTRTTPPRARTLAASPDVDALYIKDPGGLLTPKRAQTLIPAIKAEIGDKPLELHSTARSASPSWPARAADLGVVAVQCASGGAADGTSNPPISRMIANLRRWATPSISTRTLHARSPNTSPR